MSVRIKICGITRIEDAQAAVAAGADALGFVFVPGTPRHVTAAQAGEIIRSLPPFIARVGLFVDADPAVIARTCVEAGLDTVQFHGAETPEVCRRFRGALKVLKAFRVKDAAALEAVAAYVGACDAALLDAHVAGAAGGTGQAFDWTLAERTRGLPLPVVVAGGLKTENVAEAVRAFGPYGVDVSSGVEAAPGRKDVAMVRAFIIAARAAVPTSE